MSKNIDEMRSELKHWADTIDIDTFASQVECIENTRKAKTMGIPSELACDDDCPGFNFDIERMEEALKGPFYAPPDGLDIEGLRNWLLEVANNTDEENEKYLDRRDI